MRVIECEQQLLPCRKPADGLADVHVRVGFFEIEPAARSRGVGKQLEALPGRVGPAGDAVDGNAPAGCADDLGGIVVAEIAVADEVLDPACGKAQALVAVAAAERAQDDVVPCPHRAIGEGDRLDLRSAIGFDPDAVGAALDPQFDGVVGLDHRDIGRGDSGREDDPVGPARIAHHVIPVAERKAVGIVADAAEQLVVAAAAREHVVAGPGVGRIGPVDRIVARSARQDIAAVPADQQIVAGLARQLVVAEPAVERVVVASARELVVAAQPGDRVRATVAEDAVVERASRQRIAILGVGKVDAVVDPERHAAEIGCGERGRGDPDETQHRAIEPGVVAQQDDRVRAILADPQAALLERIGIGRGQPDHVARIAHLEVGDDVFGVAVGDVEGRQEAIGVAARAAGHCVGAGIGHDIAEDVVAVAARHAVGTRAAAEEVVARAPRQRVRPGGAVDRLARGGDVLAQPRLDVGQGQGDAAGGDHEAFDRIGGGSRERRAHDQPVGAAREADRQVVAIDAGTAEADLAEGIALDPQGVGGGIAVVVDLIGTVARDERVGVSTQPADQLVLAGAAAQPVRARAAIERIVVRPARKLVVARVAAEHVVAALPGEHVGPGRAVVDIDAGRARGRPDRQFAAGPHGAIGEAQFLEHVARAVDRVDQRQPVAVAAELEDQPRGALLDDGHIARRDPRAEFDPVEPAGVRQRVLPVALVEAIDVVARVTRDRIVAKPADQDVVADVAGQVVVARIARDRVVAAKRVDQVVAGTARDDVGDARAVDHVAPVGRCLRHRQQHRVGPHRAVGKADFLDRIADGVERACQHDPIGCADLEKEIGRALLFDLDLRGQNARSELDPVGSGGICDRVLTVAHGEPIDVVARVARDRVVAHPTDENVVADVAGQAVVAAVAVERIVATQRVDDVVARAPGNRVGRAGAIDDVAVVARCHRELQELGVSPHRPVREPHFLDRIGRGVERAGQHEAVARPDPEQQVGRALLFDGDGARRDPRAQLDPVDPCGVGDRVLPVARREAIDVVTRVARNRVVAEPADQDIVADITGQRVVPGIAVQRIVAAERIDDIVARAARDRVGIAGAVDDVAARARRHRHREQLRVGPDRPVGEADFLDRVGGGAQRVDQGDAIAAGAAQELEARRTELADLNVRRADPGTELDPVDPGGIGDAVLAVTDLEPVDVVAIDPGERVRSGAADQNVGTGIAGEAVVAGLAIKRVVLGSADQRVVVPTAVKRIAAGSAIERVAAC